MKRIAFLVPVADNDGQPFSPEVFEAIQAELLRSAGGYQVEGPLSGGWVDAGGTVYIDRTYRYSVVADEEAIERIRGYLKTVRDLTNQKAIWYEVSDVQAGTV